MTTTTNATITTYPVVIDYRKSLDEMIKTCRYGIVNPDITEKHFPIRGKGQTQTEVVLVHFARYIRSAVAVTELNRMDLEPARLEHACALISQYIDLQREYPIVFLGSGWGSIFGDYRVPCLGDWNSRLDLGLCFWFGVWGRRSRFAAIRKVLPPHAT